MPNPKVNPAEEAVPSSVWEALNLPRPRVSDDRIAPEVDRPLLLRLIRKELSSGEVIAAYQLIHAFDSWKKTYAELVIEEFRRNRSSEDDTDEA